MNIIIAIVDINIISNEQMYNLFIIDVYIVVPVSKLLLIIIFLDEETVK